jgi:very-short-patch-repair endonuclease
MENQLDLSQLLKRQNCLMTRRQALDGGIHPNVLRRRVRPGGRWQELLPGVYLTVTGTPTRDQRDLAALLYAGPGGTLTGQAALARHRMRGRPDVVDVLIPATRHRRNVGFVVIHRTRRLPPHVCYEGLIQFALPARAVADAVRDVRDLADVRAIVAAAVQSRRCTIAQLEDELRDGPMHGSALLRAALYEVTQGARSGPEGALFRLLKRARLPKPELNARLYVGDELIARPDAWWPEFGVAVEVDSREWHLLPEHWEETMRRRSRMSGFGITVLNFSPRQIRDEPEEVVAAIRNAIEQRRDQSPLAIRTVPAA